MGEKLAPEKYGMMFCRIVTDRAVSAGLMMLRFANTVEDLGSLGRKEKPMSNQKWTLS